MATPSKKANPGKGSIVLKCLLAILIIAWITNPNADLHRATASNELNKLIEEVKDDLHPKKKIWKILKEVSFGISNGLLQDQIQKSISSDDYLICSVTKIQLKNRRVTIGFGAFGTVWLFTDVIRSIGPELI
jgi:hypothetical protein